MYSAHRHFAAQELEHCLPTAFDYRSYFNFSFDSMLVVVFLLTDFPTHMGRVSRLSYIFRQLLLGSTSAISTSSRGVLFCLLLGHAEPREAWLQTRCTYCPLWRFGWRQFGSGTVYACYSFTDFSSTLRSVDCLRTHSDIVLSYSSANAIIGWPSSTDWNPV